MFDFFSPKVMIFFFILDSWFAIIFTYHIFSLSSKNVNFLKVYLEAWPKTVEVGCFLSGCLLVFVSGFLFSCTIPLLTILLKALHPHWSSHQAERHFLNMGLSKIQGRHNKKSFKVILMVYPIICVLKGPNQTANPSSPGHFLLQIRSCPTYWTRLSFVFPSLGELRKREDIKVSCTHLSHSRHHDSV